MIILLDTNVIGRLAQTEHAMYSVAAESVRILNQSGHILRTVPQVLYEFWAIATRPLQENGFGFSVERTAQEIDRLRAVFPPLQDERGILGVWYSLVREHNVCGKKTHDARLVAAMERHGVSKLMTFNVSDFQRFPKIEIIDPRSIVGK